MAQHQFKEELIFSRNMLVEQKSFRSLYLADTLESKNPAVGIHQSRVSSDWPPQRLHGHVHIDNNHAILRRGLPDANILIRFHRNVRKRDELRIDPDARKLQITSTTVRRHKDDIFPHYQAKCQSLMTSDRSRSTSADRR